MVRPARRLTELKTCRGPTRSSSSTGGTATTTIRRLGEWGRKPGFLDPEPMLHPVSRRNEAFRSPNTPFGGFRPSYVAKRRVLLRYDACEGAGDLLRLAKYRDKTAPLRSRLGVRPYAPFRAATVRSGSYLEEAVTVLRET